MRIRMQLDSAASMSLVLHKVYKQLGYQIGNNRPSTLWIHWTISWSMSGLIILNSGMYLLFRAVCKQVSCKRHPNAVGIVAYLNVKYSKCKCIYSTQTFDCVVYGQPRNEASFLHKHLVPQASTEKFELTRTLGIISLILYSKLAVPTAVQIPNGRVRICTRLVLADCGQRDHVISDISG